MICLRVALCWLGLGLGGSEGRGRWMVVRTSRVHPGKEEMPRVTWHVDAPPGGGVSGDPTKEIHIGFQGMELSEMLEASQFIMKCFMELGQSRPSATAAGDASAPLFSALDQLSPSYSFSTSPPPPPPTTNPQPLQPTTLPSKFIDGNMVPELGPELKMKKVLEFQEFSDWSPRTTSGNSTLNPAYSIRTGVDPVRGNEGWAEWKVLPSQTSNYTPLERLRTDPSSLLADTESGRTDPDTYPSSLFLLHSSSSTITLSPSLEWELYKKENKIILPMARAGEEVLRRPQRGNRSPLQMDASNGPPSNH